MSPRPPGHAPDRRGPAGNDAGAPAPWCHGRAGWAAHRHGHHAGHGWHGHRRPRWGLRRRLQATFIFVALAAVGLTTFFTVGTLFEVQREFLPGGVAPHPPWAGEAFPTGVGAEAAVVQDAFRRVSRTAFLAALLAFVLASMAAAVVTRLLTRPLLALTDAAHRLAAGEREVQLAVPAQHDELRVLTESFNQLAEGLARQESWRRGMVADVAHDLRTPLAVLRSEIEAMQDGLRRPDAAGLARLHGEVMMLARLVDDLRALSTVESGGVSLVREPTRLGPLLERARDAFATRAEAADVRLRLEPVAPDLGATIDPERILQVLANLIDNALRYAGGGEVVLRATAADEAGPGREGVAISVADRGPGLGPGDPQRLFERFYRGDLARGRASAADATGRTSGSGLGLAIAKALVEAHDGRIEARDRDGGGAEFRVWLPAAPVQDGGEP